MHWRLEDILSTVRLLRGGGGGGGGSALIFVRTQF